MKSITVEPNVYSGQTANCAIVIHAGYTRYCWHPEWAKGRDVALLHINLAAPKHDPDKGYQLCKWGIRWNGRKRVVR